MSFLWVLGYSCCKLGIIILCQVVEWFRNRISKMRAYNIKSSVNGDYYWLSTLISILWGTVRINFILFYLFIFFPTHTHCILFLQEINWHQALYMDDHNKSNNDCNYQTWNTLILSHNIDIQSSNPPL